MELRTEEHGCSLSGNSTISTRRPLGSVPPRTKSLAHNFLTESIVELITMTMTFVNQLCIVSLACQRIGINLTRIQSQTHRTAQILNINLFRHQSITGCVLFGLNSELLASAYRRRDGQIQLLRTACPGRYRRTESCAHVHIE